MDNAPIDSETIVNSMTATNFKQLISSFRFLKDLQDMVNNSQPTSDSEIERLEYLLGVAMRMERLVDLLATLENAPGWADIAKTISIAPLFKDFKSRQISTRHEIRLLYKGSAVLIVLRAIKAKLDLVRKEALYLNSLYGWTLMYEADLLSVLVFLSTETVLEHAPDEDQDMGNEEPDTLS